MIITHRHGQHAWHDHSEDEYEEHQRPIDDERVRIEGDPADLFDGYHTMTELYDHRRALTAVLGALAAESRDSWRSKAHNPADDPMFDGYFIVGIDLPTGTITYHYELKYWDDFAATPELEHAPKWDMAPPDATVTRLLELARQAAR